MPLSPFLKIRKALVSCQAITDASCLSFSLAAALLLQLHNAAMLPQSRLAGKQNYFATLSHSSLDMTLVFHSCFTAGLAFYVIKESRYPNI